MAFLSYFSVLSAVRAANTGAKVVFNQQTPMSAFPDRRRLPLAPALAQGGVLRGHASRLWRGRPDHRDVSRCGARSDQRASASIRIAFDVLPNPVDLDRVRAAITEPIDARVAAAGARRR